jgi:N-acetylmuramoyl-L-alanine amidase
MYKKISIVFAVMFALVLGSLVVANNRVQASSSIDTQKLVKTIVLDPGHGGSDTGAVKNGYREKDLNNRLTQKIADKLITRGYKVLFTRNPSNDIFVSLEDRVSFANRSNADLFISIHHDSSTSSAINGTSTHYSSYKPGVDQEGIYVIYNGVKYRYIREGYRGFYIDYNGTEKFVSIDDSNAYDSTPSKAAINSAELAERLVQAIGSLGIADRGARDHNLFVTRNTNMTSVLVEAGFMSNTQEINMIASDAFQDRLAQKIADVISEFLGPNVNPIDDLYKKAYDATMKAQATQTQMDLTQARILVDALYQLLPNESKNLAATFSSILDKIQHPLLVKTVDAINLAKISVKQADINTARELIIDMPNVWKNSYSMAIDAVQSALISNAITSINKAVDSKQQSDIDTAKALYSELLTVTNNNGVKSWLENELKAEMDKLAAINEQAGTDTKIVSTEQ